MTPRFFLPLLGLILSAIPALSECHSPVRAVRSVSYSTPVYSAPTYVAPVKVVKEVYDVIPVTKYVAVPYAVPFYTGYYTPPCPDKAVPASAPAKAAGLSPDDKKDILDAITRVAAKIDQQDQRISRLERIVEGATRPATMPPAVNGNGVPAYAPGPAPAPGATPAGPPAPADVAKAALAVFNAKCVSCHGNTAARDGGGLVLVENGAIAKLTDRQIRKVVSQVVRGAMPPPKTKVQLSEEEGGIILAWSDSK